MGSSFERRREHADQTLHRITTALATNAGPAVSAEQRYGRNASVYATGSYGRHEASRHSDLDLFILSREKSDPADKSSGAAGKAAMRRELSDLEEICLKAKLIEVSKELELPEFSGDGYYLKCFTGSQLARAIGSDEDDYLNTFTARLLLLLESCPLLGGAVYQEAVEAVIWAYFRDYWDHRDDFEPTFLLNDILRLWRTFCVNYENRTSDTNDRAKAKRRLKHFKLSHSRLLTCYSGVVMLLDTYRQKRTVSPDDVRNLVSQTPLGRIVDVGKANAAANGNARKVLGAYEQFLEKTESDENDLVAQFLDRDFARGRMDEARTFAKLVHDLVLSIDAGRLSQAVVV